jgi:hypothetical protein
MVKRSFFVRAVWDPEAKIFYSESDIVGLHIEAATLEQFEEVMMDSGAELIVANHLSAEDLATKSLQDLLPAIVFERPTQAAA